MLKCTFLSLKEANDKMEQKNKSLQIRRKTRLKCCCMSWSATPQACLYIVWPPLFPCSTFAFRSWLLLPCTLFSLYMVLACCRLLLCTAIEARRLQQSQENTTLQASSTEFKNCSWASQPIHGEAQIRSTCCCVPCLSALKWLSQHGIDRGRFSKQARFLLALSEPDI